MRIEDRIDIAAAPDRVWALTCDVERWPSFVPTMSRIERLDDASLGVGSRARVKQPMQRAAVWTVTDFDHGRAFAWTARRLGLVFTGGHEVVPTAVGATNVLTLDVAGAAAPVLGRLLAPVLRRAIRRENLAFKTEAERTG